MSSVLYTHSGNFLQESDTTPNYFVGVHDTRILCVGSSPTPGTSREHRRYRHQGGSWPLAANWLLSNRVESGSDANLVSALARSPVAIGSSFAVTFPAGRERGRDRFTQSWQGPWPVAHTMRGVRGAVVNGVVSSCKQPSYK